jgi:hypothetical protein
MRKENPMLKGGKTSQRKEKLKKDGEKIQTPSLKNKLKSSLEHKGSSDPPPTPCPSNLTSMATSLCAPPMLPSPPRSSAIAHLHCLLAFLLPTPPSHLPSSTKHTSPSFLTSLGNLENCLSSYGVFLDWNVEHQVGGICKLDI